MKCISEGYVRVLLLLIKILSCNILDIFHVKIPSIEKTQDIIRRELVRQTINNNLPNSRRKIFKS